MTRKQKLVLIVFGILDLIVIAGLGAVVVNQTRQINEPVGSPPPADPCAEEMLSALAATDSTTTMAWDQEIAYLTINYTATQPAISEEQHLWLAFDALPAPLPAACPLPETVLLSVRLPSGNVHTAKIDGGDLAAWLVGAQSDEDLAARALYRTQPSHPTP